MAGSAQTGPGVDRLRDVLVPLQGLPLAVEVWERDVLPARVGAYSPAWLDELCASGEVVWAGVGASGDRSGRVALYFREDAALLGLPPATGDAPRGVVHGLLRERLGRGACFLADLLVEYPEVAPDELRDALWDLVWATEATNDAFAPLRSAAPRGRRGSVARSPAGTGAGRFQRRGRGAPPLQGRWSLTAAVFGAAAPEAAARRRAWAELLLERHGIVTRELVRAESAAGGFAALYPALSALETLGKTRRGYFVEGLGGSQFGLPGAVERLRAEADTPGHPVVLAAADPAQLYGAALRWPDAGSRAPARRAGAYVVLAGGRPVLGLESGGRSLAVFRGESAGTLDAAFAALVGAVAEGLIPRLALERIDGVAATESPYAGRLQALGFRAGIRRLSLARRYA